MTNYSLIPLTIEIFVLICLVFNDGSRERRPRRAGASVGGGGAQRVLLLFSFVCICLRPPRAFIHGLVGLAILELFVLSLFPLPILSRLLFTSSKLISKLLQKWRDTGKREMERARWRRGLEKIREKKNFGRNSLTSGNGTTGGAGESVLYAIPSQRVVDDREEVSTASSIPLSLIRLSLRGAAGLGRDRRSLGQ